MEKTVLLDTNIVRRLMEDNEKFVNAITSIHNDGYKFDISDMSLFELVDSIKTGKDYLKLLEVLYDNNIRPISKVIIPEFWKQYLDWFKAPLPVVEMKKQLFDSFSFTLSTVLTDLTNAIMLYLANKLTSDYSSEFYIFILSAVEKNDTTHFTNVMRSSYLDNKFSFRKRLPLEFRDLVIRILTYYNLLLVSDTFDQEAFNLEYQKQNALYHGLSFKDICSSFLTEKDITFKANNNIEEYDEIFSTCFIKDLLCGNRKFHINDITDYISFKYAYSFCDFYFTHDGKSLAKYERYFKGNPIIDYLNRTRAFINKYLTA